MTVQQLEGQSDITKYREGGPEWSDVKAYGGPETTVVFRRDGDLGTGVIPAVWVAEEDRPGAPVERVQ